jgi:hypothetical protein
MLDGDGMASSTQLHAIMCVCVCLLPCLVMPDIKCHRFPRTRLCWCLSNTDKAPGMAHGRRHDEASQADRW